MAVADQPDSIGRGAGPAPSTPVDATPAPVDPDPAAAAALARASDELGRVTDRDPSAGLVPAVMHSVWAELRPGQLLTLPGSAGRLLVGSAAVATAITARLDELADVVVRRCTVETRAPGPDEAGPEAVPLRVELTAAVAYGTDTHELAGVVRTTVVDTVGELFGLPVDQVDLVVDDVFVAEAGR
jgi:hypothetical protein